MQAEEHSPSQPYLYSQAAAHSMPIVVNVQAPSCYDPNIVRSEIPQGKTSDRDSSQFRPNKRKSLLLLHNYPCICFDYQSCNYFYGFGVDGSNVVLKNFLTLSLCFPAQFSLSSQKNTSPLFTSHAAPDSSSLSYSPILSYYYSAPSDGNSNQNLYFLI